MSGKSTPKRNTTKARDKAVAVLPWILVAVICTAFLVNYKASFDRKLDSNGDNITYFLLAKALSEGQGYVDITSPDSTPHTHFPPGYPMFMSVFMRVFPDNVIAMKILNGLLFLMAVLMLFRIIRKTTRDNIWLAFAVCMVTVFHPTLLRWSVIMMSEMLYIVISFGIILISLDLDVESIFKKGPNDTRQVVRLILLCLLVASAYLVRTMGISVVLATALAFGVTSAKAFFKKDRSWWKPALTAAVLCLALVVTHEAWSIRNHREENGFQSDYSTGFMYTFSHERMTPSLWKERIGSNLSEFTGIWIPRAMLRPVDTMDHTRHDTPSAGDLAVGLALILLMCFGISRMKKGRVLILSYILITFTVLMLYQEQYAGVRYFIPVLPLMIFAALNGIWELVAVVTKALSKKEKTIVPSLALVAAAALLYHPYMEGQKEYRTLAGYKSYVDMNPESGFALYIKAAQWLKEQVGDDAVIACRKPEIMYMYSGYKHAVMFPLRGSEEDILGFFKSSGANCVVVDTWARHAYDVIYPVMRNHPEAFPIYYVGEKDEKADAPTLVAAFLPSKLNSSEE